LKKLNLGCGGQVIDEWINVDFALGAKLLKIPLLRFINKRIRLFNLDWNKNIFIHNLTRRFPWKDESVDIIYCSHTLEHFTRKDGLIFLEECHRVLKNNGIIRILVPDLQSIVNNYNNKIIPANEFVESLLVLYKTSGSKLKSFFAPLVQSPHKCMYDTSNLLSIMKDVGFDIQSRLPFDSDIDDIRKIELSNRTNFAVIVEGKKLG
jgi:SAM-dependent methyltransferase